MLQVHQNLFVLFRVIKNRSKNGKSAIYLRFTIDGKRVELSTYQTVDIKMWDAEGQYVKGKSEEAKCVNNQLALIKSNLYKHYNYLLALDKPLSAEILKNAYLGVGANKKTLQDVFKFYITRFEEKVANGKKAKNTLKSLKTTRQKVNSYLLHEYSRTDLFLHELKLSFVTGLEHYLTTVHKLGNNTTVKYIKLFKRILKAALEQEWMSHDPFAAFKCSYRESNRERPTMEEIITLYKKDFDLGRLEEVRDVFLFCCFTGFAYQDVFKLKPEHIMTGIDGEKWIMKEREKTNNPERVPLLPIPKEIIEKYKEHPYCLSNNCLLPVNSNQRYNGYLKEVAIICGIKKHLTTHMARHSFATTVTLEHDVPIETVSQMLGHKSIRTTQIYAKVTQRKVSNNMKDLKNKLHGQGEQSLYKINK
jgi:site-specific recombinase XerD